MPDDLQTARAVAFRCLFEGARDLFEVPVELVVGDALPFWRRPEALA